MHLRFVLSFIQKQQPALLLYDVQERSTHMMFSYEKLVLGKNFRNVVTFHLIFPTSYLTFYPPSFGPKAQYLYYLDPISLSWCILNEHASIFIKLIKATNESLASITKLQLKVRFCYFSKLRDFSQSHKGFTGHNLNLQIFCNFFVFMCSDTWNLTVR